MTLAAAYTQRYVQCNSTSRSIPVYAVVAVALCSTSASNGVIVPLSHCPLSGVRRPSPRRPSPRRARVLFAAPANPATYIAKVQDRSVSGSWPALTNNPIISRPQIRDHRRQSHLHLLAISDSNKKISLQSTVVSRAIEGTAAVIHSTRSTLLTTNRV